MLVVRRKKACLPRINKSVAVKVRGGKEKWDIANAIVSKGIPSHMYHVSTDGFAMAPLACWLLITALRVVRAMCS